MKSCYIANCDKSCCFDNTRSMFILPTDPLAMEKWKATIPINRRPLAKGDKICCRHFLESDIERYFEHTINGETHQMMRDRPRLTKFAVPSQNLQIVLDENTPRNPKRNIDVNQKSVLKKKKQLVEKVIFPENIEFDETERVFIEVETTAVLEETVKSAEENVIQTEDLASKSKNQNKVQTKKHEQQKREDFEALYEEVFAVQLPSQLWGIHRCPEMKFMAFSRFDGQSVGITDLVVHISDLWEYTVFYKSVKVRQSFLSVMTEDSITVLLDEVESAKYVMNDTKDKVHVKRKYNKQ